MVEVGNSTKTALTANQTIPFSIVTFDTNGRMYYDQTSNSIVITKVGNYEINGSFVFTPTASGDVSFVAYANGVAIPFDISTFTATATNVYTFTLPTKIVNIIKSSSGNVVKITFAVSQDGTMSNAIASVKYIE